MKAYLLFLLFIIMAAGARTMFEIAYHGAGREHDFAPEADTTRLMFLALWYVAMMIATVFLLNNRTLKNAWIWVMMVSLGVCIPTFYMLFTH